MANVTLSSGQTTTNTTVSAGDILTISSGAKAFETDILAAGSVLVLMGGATSGSLINNGATESIVAGGSAVATYVTNGGALILSAGGFAISTSVASGGREYVLGGGSAVSTQLIGGAQEFVLSGGAATGSEIESGAAQFTLLGGITTSAIIGQGGVQSIQSGAESDNTVILSGGYQLLSAGGVANSTLVSDGGQQYVGYSGMAIGTVVDCGGYQIVSGGTARLTEILNGGFEFVSAGGVGIATAVADGASLNVGIGGVVSDTTIDSGGIMFAYSNSILTDTSLHIGARLDVTYFAYNSNISYALNPVNDVLSIQNSSSDLSITLTGDYSDRSFSFLSDGISGTMIQLDAVPCYRKGTHIRSSEGELPIEHLKVGHHLVTWSGISMPILWIGRRSYTMDSAAKNRDIRPILIRRHAFSHRRPHRDLMISPDHGLLLDNLLIPAKFLVNGISIQQIIPDDDVHYYHIELAAHTLIYAEGALAETFIDDGNRHLFENFDDNIPKNGPFPNNATLNSLSRVTEGHSVERVKRRLLRRAQRSSEFIRTAPSQKSTAGYLEIVTHNLIRGWLFDERGARSQSFVRILLDDIIIGEIVADTVIEDLKSAATGNGCYGFEAVIPLGLPDQRRHVIRALRSSDGKELTNSPWILENNVDFTNERLKRLQAYSDVQRIRGPSVESTRIPVPNIRGHVDTVSRERIAGWAADDDHPFEPITVLVSDNGVPLAVLVANNYRQDLDEAGIGDGRHGFDFRIPGGLTATVRHVIEVRSQTSGQGIPPSPIVIEASTSFDEPLRKTVAMAALAQEPGPAMDRALLFLSEQVENLRERKLHSQAQATHPSLPRRDNHAEIRMRTPRVNRSSPPRRALVIDDSVPDESRDGGSTAITSHVRSLQKLGYQLSLVGALDLKPTQPLRDKLNNTGVFVYAYPDCRSVENVLATERGNFNLIYLHRLSNAAKYLALCRAYHPRARIVYSVADLHHVRLERQSEFEVSGAVRDQSRRARLAECVAALAADAVLTHSPIEATLLKRLVPEANVHVVPWAVRAANTDRAFVDRNGIAFIGSYAHPPNLDAALYLAREIMPMVWRSDPNVVCSLIGSQMPFIIRHLARPGLDPVGHVADLREIFERVRLTVAPLRYGSGIKSKVLSSLAAGVPCAMSNIAAEGIQLPDALSCFVADTASDMAARILQLYHNPEIRERVAIAGLEMIGRCYTDELVTEALRMAIGETGKYAGV